MLTANLRSSGFRKDTLYEVLDAGSVVGIINDTMRTMEFGNRVFTVSPTSKGILKYGYELTSSGELIATATSKAFFNYYTVSYKGSEWIYKAITMFATKFGLFENNQQTGTVCAGSWLSRTKGMKVDLPEVLPSEVQTFLLYLFIQQLTAPD
jgi:hypothetical protein